MEIGVLCLPSHLLLYILPIVDIDIKRKSPSFDLEVLMSTLEVMLRSSLFG